MQQQPRFDPELALTTPREEETPRRAEFSRFGGPEVVEIAQTVAQRARSRQFRVKVRFAGLNPADYKSFRGVGRGDAHDFPRGLGIDFSGVVDDVGESAGHFEVGDEVLGAKRGHALGDYILLDEADTVVRKPAALDFATAGVLANAGRAAWASVRSVGLSSADTVLVSGAAGGVGVIAAQLALRTGATVIGTASAANQSFLRELGVIPVVYGGALRAHIAIAAPGGLTAALDYHDQSTVDLALELGVDSSRINSLTTHNYMGTSDVGSAGATTDDLAKLADLVARGEIVIPSAEIYRLEDVRDAFRRLEEGHVRGKLAIDMTAKSSR